MSDRADARFEAQGRDWRDPMDVIAQWPQAGAADEGGLTYRTRGAWWPTLARTRSTLLISREYEHLLLALTARPRPAISFLRLPHPSGITFDAGAGVVHVASTRNPNQIYTFAPVRRLRRRSDVAAARSVLAGHPLVPVRSLYLPGCFYLHDMAMIDGVLHANAVGQNTVVAIQDGAARAVWWPASMDRGGVPADRRNHIQLNSIAAGSDLDRSFFSASGERAGRARPGDLRYPVDRRGVVFGGASREPVLRGLTRPHSARLFGGELWVADSGYGRVVVGRGGTPETVVRLPGWTRGLGFANGIAFAGTSRVIPRFAHYAPGLDTASSRCAIHAIDVATGRVLGSIEFPGGNQIFAIEPVPDTWTSGFAFTRPRSLERERTIFYAFDERSTARPQSL